MSNADYDLNSVRVALDLASLAECTLTMTELLRRQEPMFAEHGYRAGPPDEKTFARLGREIAAVLRQPEDDAFYPALSQLLVSTDCKPVLTRHDGVPHLHFAQDGAPLDRWLPALAVSGLVLYVCANGRSRLKRCAAAGCGRWLADTSKNTSRRYCEHACASRTTVAAFRARRRIDGTMHK